MKALADYKLNVPKMLVFLLDRVENNVGKGGNAGYQHFLLILGKWRKCWLPAFSPYLREMAEMLATSIFSLS